MQGRNNPIYPGCTSSDLNLKLVLERKTNVDFSGHETTQHLRGTNPLGNEYFTTPVVLSVCFQPPSWGWPSSKPKAQRHTGPGLAWARPHFLEGVTEFSQTSPLLPTLGEGKARTPLPQPLINAEHGFHYTDCPILLLTRHKSLH